MKLRRHLQTVLTAWMLFQCVTLLAGPQQPTKSTLQGVVRDARTNEPLVGAHVTLSSVTTSPASPPIPAVITDSTGGFVFGFDVPVSGGYRFDVGYNGYTRHATTLYFSPGQTRNDFVVRMEKTATLSGRVGTTAGKPVAGISVLVQRRFYNDNGTISFKTVATAQTNELGEYRAYWVTPGRYYVSAKSMVSTSTGVNGFDWAVRQGYNEVRDNYAETFFPGVAEVSKAVPVELAAGAEVSGLDITLPRQQRPYSVRGRLIDSSTGQSPAGASIGALFPGGALSSVGWYDRTTGTFEVRNLAPGRYAIDVRPQGWDASAGAPSATTFVTVVDSDIDNLTLTIARPPVITGRLSIEGQLPSTIRMEQLRVRLTAASTSSPPVLASPSATVSTDGTFRMNAPPEGEFRVSVSLPVNSYLKEARYNNASVLDAPARMSAAGNLEIVVSTNTGLIDGRVLNEQSQPVAGVVVVAVPNTSRDRPELFKRFAIETGSSGYFVIGDIAPGDYKLFGWERIETNSF